jgi:hypothetical protein
MLISWRALACAACVAAFGCSSSSSSGGGGPDCTSFNACGGNVVGTWNVTKACVGGTPNPLASQCPSSTAQISENASGAVTFKSDGTYSSTITTSAVEDVTLPASCLPGGATCAQLQTAINQQGDGGAGSTTGTCTAAPSGGCSCHVTVAGGGGSTNGTYSTSGTTITIDGTPSPYCVQGSGLLIQSQVGTMGMSGYGTITFAATKQ